MGSRETGEGKKTSESRGRGRNCREMEEEVGRSWGNDGGKITDWGRGEVPPSNQWGGGTRPR